MTYTPDVDLPFEILTVAEGLDRLGRMAQIIHPEDWAGPVAPMGSAGSQGAVIVLPDGSGPLLQLVDGQPVPGLEKVLEVACGHSEVAWHWLVTALPCFGRPPIAELQVGENRRSHCGCAV